MDQLKLDPKVLNATRYVAVAVDKDKASQNALRWAADNLIMKGQSVTLIHVNQGYQHCSSPAASVRSSSSSSTKSSKSGSSDIFDDEPELDPFQDMFLPFRVYTSCKDISCEAVVIDDSDIAKALIEYVRLYRIETLVLGASLKHGISKIFNRHDIPTTVLKGAPDFCNVFVISKGKVTSARAAPRPLRTLSLTAARLPPGMRNSLCEENFKASPRTLLRVPHGPGNPVSEEITNLKSYYIMNRKENCMINEALELKHEVSSEYQLVRKPSKSLSTNTQDMDSYLREVKLDDDAKRKSSDIESGEHKPTLRKEVKKKPLTPEKIEALEEKMRLLELQMKQTMDMYIAACKDALKEKQKNKELQRTLAEALIAKEEALAIAEKEKTMRIAAIGISEVVETEAEEATETENAAEKELLKEADETKVLLEEYF